MEPSGVERSPSGAQLKMEGAQFTPQWGSKTSALLDGGPGSSTWRNGPNTGGASKSYPRFDSSGGPQRWKDDGGSGLPPRADSWRTSEQQAADRWTDHAHGSRSGSINLNEQQPYNGGDRWDGSSMGRGRGRGATLEHSNEQSWKPRADGAGSWRAPGASTTDPPSRTDWRNDRWGGGQAGHWRAGPGAPPGSIVHGSMGGTVQGQGSFSRSDSYPDPSRAMLHGPGPAAGRGSSGHAPSSSFFRSFGSGVGVGGTLPWGPSKAQRRYSTDVLARVYRHLLYSGRLRLPAGVERDDACLFLAEDDFVDVVEQFAAIDPAISAHVYMDTGSFAPRMPSRPASFGPMGEAIMGGQGQLVQPAQQQQQQQQQTMRPAGSLQQPQQPQVAIPNRPQGADPGWVYRDPQGVVQGPFPRQDIIEWFDGGFFPLDLELRSASEPADAPFRPLAELLVTWRAAAAAASGGVPVAGSMGAAANQNSALQQQQHQHQQAAAPSLPDDLLSGSLQQLGIVSSPDQRRNAMGMPLGEIGAGGLGHVAQQSLGAPSMLLGHTQQSLGLQPGSGMHVMARRGDGLHGADAAGVHPSALLHSGSSSLIAPHGAATATAAPQMQTSLGDPLQQHLLQQQQQQQQQQVPVTMPFGSFPQQVVQTGYPPLQALGTQQQQTQPQQHPSMTSAFMSAANNAPLLSSHASGPLPSADIRPAWSLPEQKPDDVASMAHITPSVPQPQPPVPAVQARDGVPSLLTIQEQERAVGAAEEQQRRLVLEEQERQRQEEELRALETSSVVAPPPPPPPPPVPMPPLTQPSEPQRQRPETKPAPWVAAAPPEQVARSKSLVEIQQEEAERRSKETEAAAAVASAAARTTGPGGWARVARGTAASGTSSGLSLLDIQRQEEAAKASATAGDGENHDEDGLFWDYGGRDESSKSIQGPAAGMSAGGAGGTPTAAVALPVKAGGWAAAASKGVAPAARSSSITAQSAVAPSSAYIPPPPRPPARPVAVARQTTSAVGAPDSPSPATQQRLVAADETAAEGSGILSGQFRTWCAEQMLALTGNYDVTLCEFLVGVESNSEVAEYIATYLGSTPAAATFTSEFLKRKLAAQAALNAAATGKKSRKARARANAVAAAATTGAAVGGNVTGGEGQDPSWAAVSGAGKKSKSKKGQKLDTSMLGFGTGTDYSVLERI